MMFIILSLIVAVAAFNIVSTLVMAVTDKQSDIAILRTLGASPGSIMAVFIVQGALIGFIGLGWASPAAWPWRSMSMSSCRSSSACSARSSWPRRSITSIQPAFRSAVGRRDDDHRRAFVLALLATLYPSWRAARVNPAEALRYE
jgi:lipoprotein-releasing system permease protein